MIHHLQMKALQIGDVTGDMEREYLAFACFRELVPAHEPLNYEAAFRRPIPHPDHVLVRADALCRNRQRE